MSKKYQISMEHGAKMEPRRIPRGLLLENLICFVFFAGRQIFRQPSCRRSCSVALIDFEFGRNHPDLTVCADFGRDSTCLAFLALAHALADIPVRHCFGDWVLYRLYLEVSCASDLGKSCFRHLVRHVCLCVFDSNFDRYQRAGLFDSVIDCYGYFVVSALVP